MFDTREREIIEEKVASGRLELVVNREAKPLDEILAGLQTQPAHVVAVFDEASVRVRRGGAGQRLPMSPFCVRRKVAFHQRWNELRLEPVAGDPPFLEFIELIKQVEGNEGEGTPYGFFRKSPGKSHWAGAGRSRRGRTLGRMPDALDPDGCPTGPRRKAPHLPDVQGTVSSRGFPRA